jgi:hypothetical protein
MAFYIGLKIAAAVFRTGEGTLQASGAVGQVEKAAECQ